MPEVLFSLDQSKSFYDQDPPPHNRWHPDVPHVATVAPGTEFRLECREWFDGTIHNDDSADDGSSEEPASRWDQGAHLTA